MKRILLFTLISCLSLTAYAQSAFKVLVFSKTSGYRHGSIEEGIKTIKALGAQNNFKVDATENAEKFTSDTLNQYAAVIFLNTTGDVLTNTQQEAFERYIRSGGGYVGVHSASDTEYDWPWYGNLVGRYFDGHPAIQKATLTINNHAHPSTQELPNSWERTDEWYNFKTPFPSHLNVLITLDETTYSGGTMGNPHPIAWYHQYDGGKSFYTAMGHTNESYNEPLFRKHLLGGIFWAANQAITSTATPDWEEINIFPNPATNHLQLDLQQFNLHQPVRLEIIDLKGSSLMDTEIKEPKGMLDVSALPNGAYVLQLTGKKINYRRKLVISR